MYDDEFELTFDMAEDNAETVKLPGKPLQPAPEAPEAPEPAGKAKEPEVPDFPDDEPTIVIPARKPREMPKQEREPVQAEPVPELAPAEVKAPEEPAAAPEAPVPAIRTNGRTVLISGGDRGIGAATAKAFYEAGYRVAVLYHKNAEAAAALEKALPGCTIVQCDVASRASCELAFHAVEQALGKNIDMISRAYGTDGARANAGAVVVLDVKDGSVLASANYPSFDQNLYATQYDEYSADPSLPLFNRALQGLYTPGSTFKPAVAVAALDSGLINQYSTVNCTGVYTYYKDYRPRCTRHGHSGNIDVVTAIKWSCNIFFYDVGRRLTSDVYDAYAYKMGLGTRTGVEVNEATGRLTTKNDSNYTASLDIQAAIGQGNTVVTPVQLATYAGTLANRGVRYRTHFVKAILDTNTGKVLQETQPEVMDVIEDRGDTFDLVQQGMVGVAQTIPALASYPYTIACKTGSPQRSESYYAGSTRKHYTNATMIAYGPVEDPQIAIGIVVEYGGAGARTGQLVADIFDAYFAMQNGTLTVDEPETADPAVDDPKTEAVDGDAAADETDTAGETAPAPEPAAAPAA